jgi:hypothetical protein
VWRPFFTTTNANIDVETGKMHLHINEELREFELKS